MKNVYLEKIYENLVEAGLITRRMSNALPHDILQFRYVPDENLKRLSKESFRKYGSFSDVIKAYDVDGYLRFAPYIIDNMMDVEGTPVLCLGWNKFLRLNRGYYFQISGLPNGDCEVCKSSFRVENLIKFNLLNQNKDARNRSKLGFILLYAAYIDCGFQDEQFMNEYYADHKIIDEYFTQVMKSWCVNFEYTSDVFREFITYDRDTLIQKDSRDTIYSIYDSGDVVCRFRITNESIDVEYGSAGSMIMSMRIPDVSEGMNDVGNPFLQIVIGRDLGVISTVIMDQLRDEINSVFGEVKVNNLLVLMLLKFVGVHVSWDSLRTLRPLETLDKPESDKTVFVEYCSDFMSR